MSLRTISDGYRSEQDRINSAAKRRLIEVFPALNFKDLDGSAPGWVLAVEKVAEKMHKDSAELARDVYAAYRIESGVRGRVGFLLTDLDGRRLRASLTYLGPYAAKHALAGGYGIPAAARAVFASTSGVALRHGMQGGRSLMQRTAAADKKAGRWIRVTGSRPCGFCALMAMKIYNSQDAADQDFHDHDQCTALPRFDGVPEGYEDQIAQFEAVYSESTVTTTNKRGITIIDSKQTIRNMNRIMRQTP